MNLLNKVLVIGLDGATFDVIDPLIDKGLMPCLKSIKENGAWGRLKSIIPPVTAPAWFAIASGKNPGKTGVFGFQLRTKDDFNFEYLSSRFFKGNSFWDLLIESGKTIGIVNYPMLFPPYPVRGFMVSGMGSTPEQEITYPKNLKEELNLITSGYEIKVNYAEPRYRENDDLLLADLNRVLEKNVTSALYLMKNQVWDFFMVVISVTDWILHALFKYLDPSHPLYDSKKNQKYQPEFERFWSKIDNSVEKLIKEAQGATTFIISDHGSGPMKKSFYLNNWLEKEGYLKRKGFLNNIFTSHRKKNERVKRGGRLLWKKLNLNKTQAFCLQGNLYLNPTCLPYPHQRLALREEIKEKLQNLKDPEGRSVLVNTYQPEDIYWGEYTQLSPDLLLIVDNFEYLVESRLSKSNKIFLNHPSNPNRTGSHRLEGIILAKGSIISNGKIENACLYDIAPQILYILGIPIPEDYDGKVLNSIYKEEYLKSHPVVFGKPRPFKIEESFAREDDLEVEKRLKALGYY